MNLEFTLLPAAYSIGPKPAAEPPASADDDRIATLFTAIQEQLRLKLESIKGPVNVLVVDSVEHPMPN